MIKIKIFSNWCDSKACKDVVERIYETSFMDNYGENKEIYITDEENYTHVIILNAVMPNIKSNIPKENIIGFAFEPRQFLELSPTFIDYAKKYIGKYYIGDNYDLPKPFIEHHGYLWHITPLLHIPKKINSMSIMVSEKRNAPGHNYRHQLVEQILKSKLPRYLWRWL